MKIKHRGIVKNGKVSFENVDNFKAELKKFEGKKVYLVVSTERPTRSDQQNQYYWGVVLKMLSDETGNDADSLHEFFKGKWLKDSVVFMSPSGDTQLTYFTSMSTTKLNTVEFEEYLEKIKRYASSELGIYVPDPNDISF